MRFLLTVPLFVLLIGSFLFAQNGDGDNVWNLQRCVDYALQNNLTVQQTALGVDRNLANLAQARRQTLPNLNANVNGGLSDGFVIDPATNERTQALVLSSSLGVSSGYTVYAGGQIQNTIRQSEIDAKASELDLQASQNDISLAVVQGYVNILLQQELVESAEFQLSSTRERRERTSKLVRAGAAAPAVLLDIESQIATEELSLVNTRNQVELAHLRLMQLLRLPLDRPFGVERPSVPDPESNLGGLKPAEVYKIAEANQPVIRAADLRIQSADYGIKIAQGSGKPTLGLSAGLNSVYSSGGRQVTFQPIILRDTIVIDDPTIPFDNIPITAKGVEQITNPYPIFSQLWDQVNWSVGANLSIPIFNRGRVVNSIEQARIAKQQAEITSEIQRQNLEQIIQQASFDVKSSFAQYDATGKQVKALETAFANAQKQFNLGVINSVDYLVAKNNLNRANNDLIRAKYDYIFKSKILDFYAGREIKL